MGTAVNQAHDDSGRWFVGRTFDLSLLHVPIWLTWLAVLAMPAAWRDVETPTWVWVAVVLLIDVGHVWSSLYRTYLDPTTRRHHRAALRWTPLLCFVLCFAVAAYSDQTFWRILAYVAVYHFVKQQVGVAALYRYRHLQSHARAGRRPFDAARALARVDKLAVYAGTLGPLTVWHFTPDKRISWFIPGDFLGLDALSTTVAGLPGGEALIAVAKFGFYLLWFGSLAVWLAAHLYWGKRLGLRFPLGKMAWVFGTWINWWLGIVYFDSDLAFTLTNVVAHGVPYYGLIGLYCMRRYEAGGYPRLRLPGAGAGAAWRWAAVALFTAPILALALMEEYLWNFLLYRDYSGFFEALWQYPAQALADPLWRAAAIAFLALPQTVHYVLDGFIWKMNGSNPDLKARLFPE